MKSRVLVALALLSITVFGIVAASILSNTGSDQKIPDAQDAVHHKGKYGIYAINLATKELRLIYSTDNEIYTSALSLNKQGEKLVFAQKTDGVNDENTEILTINVDGQNLYRLTTIIGISIRFGLRMEGA